MCRGRGGPATWDRAVHSALRTTCRHTSGSAGGWHGAWIGGAASGRDDELADRAAAVHAFALGLGEYEIDRDPTRLVYPVWRDPDVLKRPDGTLLSFQNARERRKILRYVYAGAEHEYESRKPEKLELK